MFFKVTVLLFMGFQGLTFKMEGVFWILSRLNIVIFALFLNFKNFG
jgi:hypothetical protein